MGYDKLVELQIIAGRIMKYNLLSGIVVVSCLVSLVAAQTAVNCTEEAAAGRFADPDDTTCQNYTLCVYSSTTDTYTGYDYVCPTTSVFNPNSQQCTDPANYVCNVTSSATNTSVCTEDGFIADPTSTDCTTYIQCVEVNGTFTETTLTCPDDTFYDPDTTLCESDYTCATTDTTTVSPAFTCTTAGRFEDSTDSTCQTYYLCVLASNGTFTQYTYTCPTTSVFNPNTSVCTASSNYTCDN